MIILSDTRQKENRHDLKLKYFAEHNIEVRRTKLYIGDYTLPTDQSVCVDTKFCIEELVSDICGKQHERFRNELLRAQESGVKLIILVENKGSYVKGTQDIFNPTIHNLSELHKWRNPRLFIMKDSNEIIGTWKNGKPRYKKIQAFPQSTKGESLMKACFTMQEKYGCEFLFCSPQEAGKKIIELLGVNVDG